MFLCHSVVSHAQLVFLHSVCRDTAVLCLHIHLLVSFWINEVFLCQPFKPPDAKEEAEKYKLTQDFYPQSCTLG